MNILYLKERFNDYWLYDFNLDYFPPLFLIDGTFFDGLCSGIGSSLLGTVTLLIFSSNTSWGIVRCYFKCIRITCCGNRFALILKEDVQGLQWLGVALILSAIALTNLKLRLKRIVRFSIK